MLFSIRNGACAFVAVSCLAGAASAEEHWVRIVEGAYFPALVHAEVGDTVLFVNETDAIHEVHATDESWTSGQIPVDGSFSLLLAEDTVLAYTASVETEGDGDGAGDETLEQNGEISFDPPPPDNDIPEDD